MYVPACVLVCADGIMLVEGGFGLLPMSRQLSMLSVWSTPFIAPTTLNLIAESTYSNIQSTVEIWLHINYAHSVPEHPQTTVAWRRFDILISLASFEDNDIL